MGPTVNFQGTLKHKSTSLQNIALPVFSRADNGTVFRSSLSPGSMTKSGFLSSAFLGGALERARRKKEERERPVQNTQTEIQEVPLDIPQEAYSPSRKPERSAAHSPKRGSERSADGGLGGNLLDARYGIWRRSGACMDLEDNDEEERCACDAGSKLGDLAGKGLLFERPAAARLSAGSTSW